MSMHIKNKVIQRGFTLIELLVVIAIIGILASVVLASLNTARAKGADAAVKSTINNGRAQAELYYDNNTQSYLGVCAAATGLLPMRTGVTNAGGTESCVDVATAYRFSSILKAPSTTSWYCADSTGKAEVETSGAPGGTACP